MMPQLREQDGSFQLVVDGHPFTMLAGELHNSSASSLQYLEPILDRLVRCNLNTVLAPVSWELLEPNEGEFDFTLIDGLVDACRRRGLKLVPLWFGTMKNAISCYTPEWVKTDLERFPRAETTPGTPGWTVSPFGQNILEADSRAFAALLSRIREIDGDNHTVIMVQVENESGVLNASRDYAATAQAAFEANVPESLIAGLDERCDELHPEMRAARERSEWRKEGSWREIFGVEADQAFMAWHIASFIHSVAAAGRAEYDLPMFTNAWLPGGPGIPPGKYPSGGPIPKMLDVWRVAAPSLDVLAPDVYQKDFREHCAAFSVNDNPLFVPEARNSAVAAGNALYVIGEHRALGFSPFGIDEMEESHPLVETYERLRETLKFLQKHYPDAEMRGFVQQEDEERWEGELAGFRFQCRTAMSLEELYVPGSALLVHLTGDEFLCLGRSLIFTFTGSSGCPAEMISVDLGECRDGEWQYWRRLNGDETGHGTGVVLSGFRSPYAAQSAVAVPEHNAAPLDLCRFRIFDPLCGDSQ